MRRFLRLAAAALIVTGCGGEDRQALAATVVQGYFEAIKARDAERASTHFSSRSFEVRDAAAWRQDFDMILARLGPLESYRLTAATQRTDFVPPDTGSFVALRYSVRYARFPAVETFVVHRPFTGREYRILSHSIETEGFLK